MACLIQIFCQIIPVNRPEWLIGSQLNQQILELCKQIVISANMCWLYFADFFNDYFQKVNIFSNKKNECQINDARAIIIQRTVM